MLIIETEPNVDAKNDTMRDVIHFTGHVGFN